MSMTRTQPERRMSCGARIASVSLDGVNEEVDRAGAGLTLELDRHVGQGRHLPKLSVGVHDALVAFTGPPHGQVVCLGELAGEDAPDGSRIQQEIHWLPSHFRANERPD